MVCSHGLSGKPPAVRFPSLPSLCVPPFRFTQAEEAKAVIPSLREEGKIDNDVLNSLLMELTTFAK